MYNYYQQQPIGVSSLNRTQNTYAPALLKGHPVSSLEEVKATSIDFDGSIFYFPDIANKRIYTKTVDINGIASLNMYELTPLPQDNNTINTGEFSTRSEFEAAIMELSKQLPNKKSTSQNYKEAF